MKCPLCDYNEVDTTWVDHEFQYGEDVMLKCRVPLRTCHICEAKWLDHRAEDIITEVVELHLKPAIVVDDEWIVEATLAASRADAYNVFSVIKMMKSSKLTIGEMDEWCAQGREDYPCLFKAHVVSGLG